MKCFGLILCVAEIRQQIWEIYTNGISYYLWRKSKIFIQFYFYLIYCSVSNVKIFSIGIYFIIKVYIIVLFFIKTLSSCSLWRFWIYFFSILWAMFLCKDQARRGNAYTYSAYLCFCENFHFYLISSPPQEYMYFDLFAPPLQPDHLVHCRAIPTPPQLSWLPCFLPCPPHTLPGGYLSFSSS